MKRFFLWMAENGKSEIPEKKLRDIKPPNYVYDTKNADMIFTKEEVFAMLKACRPAGTGLSSLFYMMAHYAVVKLGTLRWNQVVFTDVDATITVKFKTEKTRLIPLFMAKEYLGAWRNDYSGGSNRGELCVPDIWWRSKPHWSQPAPVCRHRQADQEYCRACWYQKAHHPPPVPSQQDHSLDPGWMPESMISFSGGVIPALR